MGCLTLLIIGVLILVFVPIPNVPFKGRHTGGSSGSEDRLSGPN